MLATCQHDFEVDSAGDEREARDEAITRRALELMQEECCPFTPEALGEVLASGYLYKFAEGVCDHLDKADKDENREANLQAAGQQLIALANGYWWAKAVQQATQEIR